MYNDMPKLINKHISSNNLKNNNANLPSSPPPPKKKEEKKGKKNNKQTKAIQTIYKLINKFTIIIYKHCCNVINDLFNN